MKQAKYSSLGVHPETGKPWDLDNIRAGEEKGGHVKPDIHPTFAKFVMEQGEVHLGYALNQGGELLTSTAYGATFRKHDSTSGTLIGEYLTMEEGDVAIPAVKYD